VDLKRKEEMLRNAEEVDRFRLTLISRERSASWLTSIPAYGAGLE